MALELNFSCVISVLLHRELKKKKKTHIIIFLKCVWDD